MWELSTETNRIETAVVRYGVATIFATVRNDEEVKAGRIFLVALIWLLSAGSGHSVC